MGTVTYSGKLKNTFAVDWFPAKILHSHFCLNLSNTVHEYGEVINLKLHTCLAWWYEFQLALMRQENKKNTKHHYTQNVSRQALILEYSPGATANTEGRKNFHSSSNKCLFRVCDFIISGYLCNQKGMDQSILKLVERSTATVTVTIKVRYNKYTINSKIVNKF